jgi:major capsid protein gp7
MATLTATQPTLLDLVRRQSPDGGIETNIVEILNAQNEVLEDMTWVEGNLVTGNKTTVRTGIPAPTWRKLYGYVQPTKSTTLQVTDNCGMLEAYTQIDKALADLNSDAAAFRLSEEKPQIEGFNQEFVQTLFYGNETTEPEAFTGFSARYNLTTAENGSNIIPGGSVTADVNTSIWLIGWGENTMHGIIPKGSKAGIQHEDLGTVTALDSNGGMFQAYRSHYRWDLGLTVRDWRYAVRIPNIQVSALKADAASGANLIDLMAQALELIPSLSMCRPVFYCNRTIKSYLRRQMQAKALYQTRRDEVMGRHVTDFDGVPVKRCDAILNTEAIVS